MSQERRNMKTTAVSEGLEILVLTLDRGIYGDDVSLEEIVREIKEIFEIFGEES